MTITECYKVTEKNLGSFNCIPEIGIQYKVGEFVKPKISNSKIFVFKKKEDVFKFLKGYNRKYKIFQCEAKNLKKAKNRACSSKNSIVKYWNYKRQHKKVSHLIWAVPYGTYFCDELKLVKLME